MKIHPTLLSQINLRFVVIVVVVFVVVVVAWLKYTRVDISSVTGGSLEAKICPMESTPDTNHE